MATTELRQEVHGAELGDTPDTPGTLLGMTQHSDSSPSTTTPSTTTPSGTTPSPSIPVVRQRHSSEGSSYKSRSTLAGEQSTHGRRLSQMPAGGSTTHRTR